MSAATELDYERALSRAQRRGDRQTFETLRREALADGFVALGRADFETYGQGSAPTRTVSAGRTRFERLAKAVEDLEKGEKGKDDGEESTEDKEKDDDAADEGLPAKGDDVEALVEKCQAIIADMKRDPSVRQAARRLLNTLSQFGLTKEQSKAMARAMPFNDALEGHDRQVLALRGKR